MNNNIDLNRIDEYNVHILRSMVRKLRLHNSPTTLKKKELIKLIRDFISGKTNAISDGSLPKVGRPVKMQDNISLLDVVASLDDNTTEEEEDSDIENKSHEKYDADNPIFKKYVSSMLNSSSLDQGRIKTKSSEEVEGYLDIYPNGDGILRVEGYTPSTRDVYVLANIINSNHLLEGDYIKGNAYYATSDNILVLNNVLEINNNKSKVVDYQKQKYGALVDILHITKDIDIYLGGRNYIRNTPECTPYDVVSKMQGNHIMFLDLKAKPEYQPSASEDMEYIPLYFNSSDVDIVNTTNLVINRCVRMVEYGDRVMLFINNFTELIKAYSITISKKYDMNNINYQAITKIQNILFNAKYIDNDKYFTIVCADRSRINPNLEDIINEEFLEVFNNTDR